MPNRKKDSFFQRLPMTIQIYCVGGAVRDFFLKRASSDKDYLLVGADIESLKKFNLKTVGKDFPVFLHPETNEEIALARTEKKKGLGYKGFTFYTSKNLTVEDDLQRRDLTINSMAVNEEGVLIDPFNGFSDIKNKVFKNTSSAFIEDPLRLIRLARFCSYFPEFTVKDQTLEICKDICSTNEIKYLSKERIWVELSKGLIGYAPSEMLKFLIQTGAWNQITNDNFSINTILNKIDLAKNSNLPIKWIASLLFENYEIEKINCNFPGEVKKSIRIIKKARKYADQIKKNFHEPSVLAEPILKLTEVGNLFRQPKEINNYLSVCFMNDPRITLFLNKVINSLINESVHNVIDENRDERNIKEIIRKYRINFLKKLV